MTEDLIEVRYYYVPKTKLIVKYVDINTGEEITEEIDGNIVSTTIEKDGIVNEEYTTTQKEFDDYIVISNRIYYKNNLYSFCDLPIITGLIIKILSSKNYCKCRWRN
jgi:hypothetical protein